MSSTDNRKYPSGTAGHNRPFRRDPCAPALALTSILYPGDAAGLLLRRP